MQSEIKNDKSDPAQGAQKPLSETISNAHGSGDGSLRLSEDGLIEPSGESLADAEADKNEETNTEEY